MTRYTAEERGEIVSMFLKNNKSVVSTQREFSRKYPDRQTPTGQTLRRLVARLEETGSIKDLHRQGRLRSSRSAEIIAAVDESVQQNPTLSTRQRAAQLGISRRSLQRILTLDLKLFPYKVQTVHQSANCKTATKNSESCQEEQEEEDEEEEGNEAEATPNNSADYNSISDISHQFL